MPNDNLRECFDCNEFKVVSRSNFRWSKEDGWSRQCNSCKNAKDRQRYKFKKENPTKREYDRKFREKFYGRLLVLDNGCHVWTGCRTGGYGSMSYNGLRIGAHIVAWELENGSLPDALDVCHKCDNPPCCNPDHLFSGTHLDNMKDRDQKGRGNSPKGSNHKRSKVTEQGVIDMRRRYSAGGVTYKQLGDEYGITATEVCYICKRKIWRHV